MKLPHDFDIKGHTVRCPDGAVYVAANKHARGALMDVAAKPTIRDEWCRANPDCWMTLEAAEALLAGGAHNDNAKPKEEPAEDAPLKGDTAKLIAHLKERGGYPILSASWVDPVTGKKGRFETRQFASADDPALPGWIEERLGRANIYAAVNEPRRLRNGRFIDKKAENADTQFVHRLHCDVDGRAGEPQDEAIARIIKLVEGYKIPPTEIHVTGGGCAVYWELEKPLENPHPYPEGDPDSEEFKAAVAKRKAWAKDIGRYNLQLERDLGGDHCHDVSRIMRAPFTVNIPDEKKRAKGRVAALSYVQSSHPERHYEISAFKQADDDDKPGNVVPFTGSAAKAKAKRSIAYAAQVTPDVQKILDEGPDPAHNVGHSDMKVMGEFKRLGMSLDDIKKRWRASALGKNISEWGRAFDEELERLYERVPDSPLVAMNEIFSAGSVRGKFRIIKFVPDSRYPKQSTAEFYSVDDFRNAVVNPRIEVPKFKDGVPDGVKLEPAGAWWLAQRGRREYDGIDFLPGRPAIIETPDPRTGRAHRVVNMYSGFACTPDFDDSERKCALYLAHVHDNIAGGDATLYNYILDWMASGVQHPENPGRTALSLRGNPGAGKGVFVLGYGGIFGHHFTHATHKSHVTGNFNSHQALACLIFVDEALYADIREDAQILKTMTTETTKILERKGIDAIQIENFARLIFSTNAEHPIVIEHNDRRYVAIYVRDAWAAETSDDTKAEKRAAYFGKIIAERDNGGREALLGYLLRRDISSFNPEKIPNTAERQKQKLDSADAGDKFIIGLAQDGTLPAVVKEWPKPGYRTARANGADGLFPVMRERGGAALRIMSDHALAVVIKRWGFRPHPYNTFRAWDAPALADLRAAIDVKFGAQDYWDTRADWGAPLDADQETGALDGIL